MGIEIERKWLPDPEDAEKWIRNSDHRTIIQGYLSCDPVIRVRRDGEAFYMTYKGKGIMVREEYNLPLTKEAFDRLLPKCEGNIIEKERHVIPLEDGLILEADVFAGKFSPLILFEVEFPGREEAECFTAPESFGREVTGCRKYTNAYLSQAMLDVN